MKDEIIKEYLDAKEEGAESLQYNSEWLKQQNIEEGKKARKRKKIKRISLGIGIPVAITASLAALIIIPNLEVKTENHSKTLTKKSSSISQSDFKSLNSVEYPSYSSPEEAAKKNAVSEDYVSSVNEFSYSLYKALQIGGSNAALSPYSIYRGLDILSLIGNPSTKDTFSSLLGEETLRASNRAKGFLSNNWDYQDEGVLMRDGAFFSSYFGEVKSSVLKELASSYVEAYQMNFSDQANLGKMLDWLKGYSLDEGMFSLDDLPTPGLDEQPSFCLLSLQSVKLHWAYKYSSEDNQTAPFYKLDGTTESKEFMSHVAQGVKLYDYGSYYSAYDVYKHGYGVQYLIPKSTDDSILDLLDRNFLSEDENKRVKPESYYGDLVISKFLLPKFSYADRVDLASAYKKLGLSSLMDPGIDSFGEAYEPQKTEGEDWNHYLCAAKSVTKVSMDEDGFISKSLAFHFSMAAGSAAPIDVDTYLINLNQPFVYVIRDANGLPLNLGYYQG